MNSRADYRQFAKQIRIETIRGLKELGFGHIGGALSVCVLLAVLYGSEMRFRPDEPLWAERDKLVCSK